MKLLLAFVKTFAMTLCGVFIFLCGTAVGFSNWLAASVFALFALVCLGIAVIYRKKE